MSAPSQCTLVPWLVPVGCPGTLAVLVSRCAVTVVCRSVLSKDGSGMSTVDQEEVYEALATASVAVVVGLALWKGLRLCREYRRRSKEAAARRGGCVARVG